MQLLTEKQSFSVGKVQRSLTWTEGSGSNSACTDAEANQQASPSQQQRHQQQQQQQQLGLSMQSSMTLEDAASLQSSPSLQPPKRGASLHRQRLAATTASALGESGLSSSNSGHVTMPARFQAGQYFN